MPSKLPSNDKRGCAVMEIGPFQSPCQGFYEHNWHHVEMAAMEPADQALLAKLTATIGKGVMNV
jgi:hypothetical protein